MLTVRSSDKQRLRVFGLESGVLHYAFAFGFKLSAHHYVFVRPLVGRETRSVVRLTRAFAPCQSGRACKPTGPNITTQNFSCPSLRLFRMRWVFSRPPRPAVAQGNPPVAGQCFPPIPPGQELREPAQCATSVPSVSTVRRAVRRSVWRRSVLFQRRRATVGAVHPAVGPANQRRRDYLADGRASRYPLGWRLVDLGCALYYALRV